MKVLPFIPLLVLVAACSNDPDHPAPAPQEQGEKITLTAALGGGNVQTRIDYDDSDEPGAGVRLTWTADDAFLAYTADGKRSLFTLSEGAESDRGTFTGTAPDATNKFNVFYPTLHTYKDATDQKLYASLAGQTQTGNQSMEHLADYNFMGATVDDITQPVTFHHLLAMMRFDLTLTDYDATTDGKPLLLNLSRTKSDGTFNFGDKLELGADATTTVSSNGSSVQLNLHNIDLTSSNNGNVLKAYLMVPPFRVQTDNQLIITVTCAKGTVYRFTSLNPAADKSYEAGKRYRATCTLVKTTAAADASVFDDDTQASAGFSGGDGEAATPYLISSAADLKYLVEINSTSQGSTDYADKYFKLTTDIRVEATEWVPIGSNSYSFAGNFNGDGHTIGGKLTGKAMYFGFFGAIYETTVERLHITADVTNSGEGSELMTGALVGMVVHGTLLNCSNSGTVTAGVGRNNSISMTGGLVGTMAAAVTLIGCNNLGDVNSACISSFGALVGGLSGGSLDSDGCTMQNCCNYGNLTAQSPHLIIGGILGGMALNETSLFTDCVNYGTLSIPQEIDEATTIGGLFGLLITSKGVSTLHNCLNKATLPTTSAVSKGGLVGTLGFDPANCTIADCCADMGSGLDKPFGHVADLNGDVIEDFSLTPCSDGHIHRTHSTQ